jgi:hypothetical protein
MEQLHSRMIIYFNEVYLAHTCKMSNFKQYYYFIYAYYTQHKHNIHCTNQTCYWNWICWKNIKYVQLVNSINMLKHCAHKTYINILSLSIKKYSWFQYICMQLNFTTQRIMPNLSYPCLCCC